jgi:dTDP-4-dehydrorhamnose 3,5-epimerase
VPDLVRRSPASLAGVRILERPVFRDARGTFAELWREEDAMAAGLPHFVQDNVARSGRGVVRGLHFQNPRAQAKLVSVAIGEVFDVAVDVRLGSPTFGRWMGVHLSELNGRQVYIPPGFAHAYQTLSDVSVVVYKCSDFYSPDEERTVRWSDDTIGIDWPLRDAIVSPRDANAPLLRDMLPEWLPQVDQ